MATGVALVEIEDNFEDVVVVVVNANVVGKDEDKVGRIEGSRNMSWGWIIHGIHTILFCWFE